MNILIVFTCFNRRKSTEKCIKSIVKGNSKCNFSFVIADDGSTDGTYELLKKMSKSYHITILKGNGNWFYSKGMNVTMQYALKEFKEDFDYLLMINDDVEFFPNSIENMVEQSHEQGGAIIIGVMCDSSGYESYGAIKYVKGYKYVKFGTKEWNLQADTFNANCVLIPYTDFLKSGAMDPYYIHSLGDFDYGLVLKRNGSILYPSKRCVGLCSKNSLEKTWNDKSLGRIERIRKKESPKGAPTKQWFYFLNKNFGFFTAIKGSIMPYLRILIGL